MAARRFRVFVSVHCLTPWIVITQNRHLHDVRVVCSSPELHDKKWYIAALVSWGLALFEYLFQVPANRIGYSQLSLGQLKILQEVITLAIFAPFAILYMRQPLNLNFVWAAMCMVGAVYFMFRG